MEIKQYIKENESRFLEELFSLIRIPSISALPEHKSDMQACADKLTELGVQNELYIPENKDLPHGFLNLARTDEQAAEAERQLIDFMKRATDLA